MGIERNYNVAVDFIDRNVAEGRGNKAAFVDASRAISYAQLHDAVARVGPALARFGVEPENRIAIILYDSIEFPILFWGTIRAGIVPVLLNTLLTEDQYHYLLADSRAKMAFVSAALLPIVERAAADVPTLRQIVAVGDGPHSQPQLDALLAGQGRIGMREDDVIFSAAKLFFAYGIGTSICSLGVGATSVLYPGRPTPKTVFEVLRQHRPTMFFAVPTLYAAILADPECTPELGAKQLRLCFSAGEPLPPHIGITWRERFGVDIVNGVGSSELGHLFLTNLPDAVEYGTSGVPVEGYDMRLVDAAGQDIPDGEI